MYVIQPKLPDRLFKLRSANARAGNDIMDSGVIESCQGLVRPFMIFIFVELAHPCQQEVVVFNAELCTDGMPVLAVSRYVFHCHTHPVYMNRFFRF